MLILLFLGVLTLLRRSIVQGTDAAILRVCTKVSHALQRATGLTCYFVAKVGIFAVGAAVIVTIVDYYGRFLEKHSPWWMVIIFFVFLLAMVRRSLLMDEADDCIQDGVKPRRLAYYVNEHFVWRLIWVCLAVTDFAFFCVRWSHFHYWVLEFISQIGFSLGMAIFYYFVAVDPLPPGKNKVREWLKKFTAVLKPIPLGR